MRARAVGAVAASSAHCDAVRSLCLLGCNGGRIADDRCRHACTWQIVVFTPDSFENASLVKPVLMVRLLRTVKNILSLKR